MRITERPRAKATTAQSLGEGEFSVTLKPDVGLPGSFYSDPGKYVEVTEVGAVTIPFRIDVEAREWGIKGVMISVSGTEAAVEVVVEQEGQPEHTRRIVFDPSRIELHQVPGGAVTINGLALSLDESLNVDYSRSYFEATTLMGDAR